MKNIRIVHGTLLYPLEVGSRALIFEEGRYLHTSIQLQLVIGSHISDLLNIKRSQTSAAGNQNRLSGLARDEKSRTFSSNSKRSHILRTSSRSRRLILSSIVSFAVWLKWTRTI